MNSSEYWNDSRLAEPSKLLKFNVHAPFQSLSTEHIQKLSAATALPVALMLYNLTGDINIGMSIRTAAILGCSDVFVVGKRRYDRRSEVGAKNYIQIHRLPKILPSFFAEHKLIPIFIEQGGIPLEEFSFKPYLPNKIPEGHKVVIVVGSEAYGLPLSLIRSIQAPILSISQYGVMRSFNVSVAASIVLYEFSKQWRASVVI